MSDIEVCTTNEKPYSSAIDVEYIVLIMIMVTLQVYNQVILTLISIIL